MSILTTSVYVEKRKKENEEQRARWDGYLESLRKIQRTVGHEEVSVWMDNHMRAARAAELEVLDDVPEDGGVQ